MAMDRCPKGHYYDKVVNKGGCPYCREQRESEKTVKAAEGGSEDPKTVSLRKAAANAAPASGPVKAPAEEGGKTVAIAKEKVGFDPVVGWLVCIKGPEKGRDYRIHSEKNSVGRSDAMDISIKDETISREGQAFIVYNPKKRLFRLHPGMGQSLVYLNDDEVVTPAEMKGKDRITIGQSEFIFVPLCGEDFDWDDLQAGEKETDAEIVLKQIARALKDQS